MGTVVPLRRCRRCGQPAGCFREVEFQGRVEFSFWACRKCLDETMADLAKERKVFEGLLALGVSCEVANVMMIAKHEHEAKK